MLLAIAGFSLFGVGGSLTKGHPAMIGLVVLGFALFGGSIVYTLFGGRCMHCSRPLSRVFSQTGGAFGIASDVQFCPYCGTSIDDEQT